MTKSRLLRLILGGLLIALSLSASGGGSDLPTASPLRLEPEKIPYSEMNTDMPPWPEKTFSQAYPSIDTSICTRAILTWRFTKPNL